MSWKRNLRDASDVLRRSRNPSELIKGLVPKQWLSRHVLNDTTTSAHTLEASEVAASLRRLRNLLKTQAIALNGHVDYAGLRGSSTFAEMQEVSAMLRSVDLGTLADDAIRIAFWTNIYNVLAIHGVLALEIRDSVMEIPSFFGTVAYDVGGFVVTLDEIENGILRRNAPHPATGVPLFQEGDLRLSLCPSRVDPRIHAALVCASTSCPPVAFYDAEHLDSQLDAATRGYIAADVLVDEAARRVMLPITFRYYESDFGGPDGIWGFLLRYTEG
ncbi:MAG: DUF547 domain-containing protein, partial [Polyangiales bacterium]